MSDQQPSTDKQHQAGSPARREMNPRLLSELRAVSILATLPDTDLECLLEAEVVELPAGTVIARQGDPGEYFWIVLSGGLRLYQISPEGMDVTVATAPAGTSLGEVPLLANMANVVNLATSGPSRLLRLTQDQFWALMTACPDVRRAVLGNMARRFQKVQTMMLQQEKMASLGSLAAGLMHELNNPGTAARRAASQLRENLLRMHALGARFTRITLSPEQRECMLQLQQYALAAAHPQHLDSLEQSDAEEALARWMESAGVEDAWKLAPPLVAIGIDAGVLECARSVFPLEVFSDALSWLEALVSSMHLVTTVEESVGRVAELARAVKLYAYEAKGKLQTVHINEGLYATVMILGHKLREKQVVLEKKLAADLQPIQTTVSGLNQVWTNLLDNAIDAVQPGGRIRIHTWNSDQPVPSVWISIEDNGGGIPLDCQEHIFDPFYTTKDIGVGTGLGLGIAHRIVEQHGGSIRFSSTPGETEFVVRLPIAMPAE